MIKKFSVVIAMALLVCTFAHADEWTKITQHSDDHELFARSDSSVFFALKGDRWRLMIFKQHHKDRIVPGQLTDRITPEVKYAVSTATCRKGSGPITTWQLVDGDWQRIKSYAWKNDLWTLEDEAVDYLCRGLVPESERPKNDFTMFN